MAKEHIVRIWINDGKYSQLYPQTLPIPFGWRLGRASRHCVKSVAFTSLSTKRNILKREEIPS